MPNLEEVKDVEPEIQDDNWFVCCSRSNIRCVKYFSTLSICSFVVLFSSFMLIRYPHDEQQRAVYLPLLSSMIMLFIDPPRH